ncbi:hypothetical protein M9Y10_015294 [Tritrichomonas musculus]|uniref:Guanylate cyclase domain-containing protein n=1 Tax=Tritrichomonas musculus TaxID=1915356 RepID=A0ABR2L1Z5_9EUKA
MNHLKLLDSIQTDKTLFSYVKSPNKFLLIANTGIKYAHPIVLDLTLFILATEKWQKNSYVYLIYAKFISIYPEEAVTLKYIYKFVKLQKLKGSAARCIKRQTGMILNQREGGLTAELRSKINLIKKQNQLAKHKLGHVWDVVIRGNLNEIEVATKRAINSINDTNAEFKHLLHEFPNNRNVTYFYSTFLNELMADQNMSDEMHRRSRLLLPGISIVEDQTHEYGLKQFPNLPSSIKVQKDQPMMTSTVETAQLFQHDQSELSLKRDRQKDLEQIAGIRQNIENLVIPSIRGTKIMRILSSLFMFIIPCIIGLILIEYYIKKLQRPMKFLASLSMLRTYAYQVIAFSLRFVGQCLGVFEEVKEHPEKPPKSFGNTWDTKEQLEYILGITTNALQDFGSFRMFEENDRLINQAQALIFQNTVPYVYYTSPTNVTTSNISIQAAILDFTIQTKMILTATNMTNSILSSGAILNPINNVSPISTNIRDAMYLMIEYMNSNYSRVKKFGNILYIVLIAAEILIFISTLIIQLKWINSNKKETYQCLFSLPKNVVSELAENRGSKKKDNQAEEMNKQDENILKIFNSGGSSEDSFSDAALLVAGSILVLIFAAIVSVLFVLLVINLTKSVRNSAPHLHYLMGSYSMILSSINWLHIILFEFGDNPIPNLDFNYSLSQMLYIFEISKHYFHMISAGGPSSSEVPFRGFTDGVRNASPKNCSSSNISNDFDYSKQKKFLKDQFKFVIDRTFSKPFIKSNFNSLTDVLQCSPVDMIFTLIEPIVLYSILPFQKGIVDKVDPKSPAYGSIWIQLITPLYDLFFEPLHNQINPSITDDLKNIRNQYIPIIATFLVVGILIEIILYIHVMFIENHIRSVLSLLLHCQTNVIFSSSKITRVLSGDFSSQQNDSLDRNNSFFDTVFTSLPDAIMYANSDMIIQNANQACKHTFGDIVLVGKNIRDFFMSNNFSGNTESLFLSVTSNHTEELSYKTANSNLILKATSMIACGKFVISCRNVTQSHNYNTLILEEKQNSDKLLSTILPPSLVGRVQEGEKNISFSVQSASILFSDIVNFTPWCGSLPAQTVMSTLNILFKRFDSILDTKPTMTKIKCIGDCYMAAGGIFAELNQPAVHAREVVSFGLQSTREIQQINEEINQNLKIRIGVNTGGPIVAGVLGIGKPTFEILGPAINRAQQMEQNGFPMKVHISISVYELICGFNFKFVNRRQIECKGEMVETYLVEP